MIRHTLGISIAPGTEIIDYADENEISRETKKSSEKEDSKKITRQGEGRKKNLAKKNWELKIPW